MWYLLGLFCRVVTVICLVSSLVTHDPTTELQNTVLAAIFMLFTIDIEITHNKK